MKGIECMTSKTGKFVFSCTYNIAEIHPKNIEAHIRYEAVRDLPIHPEMAAKIKEDLIRRSIFGTAAIEGNRLTEEGGGRVLEKTSREALADNAEREIHNLKTMYRMLGKGSAGQGAFFVEMEYIRKQEGTDRYEINMRFLG